MKHLITLIKATSHGIIIPTFITLLVFYNTSFNLLKAEATGAAYLVIPMIYYISRPSPEPAGFSILSMVYIFGMYITYFLMGSL